jgi:hypothetical protein
VTRPPSLALRSKASSTKLRESRKVSGGVSPASRTWKVGERSSITVACRGEQRCPSESSQSSVRVTISAASARPVAWLQAASNCGKAAARCATPQTPDVLRSGGSLTRHGHRCWAREAASPRIWVGRIIDRLIAFALRMKRQAGLAVAVMIREAKLAAALEVSGVEVSCVTSSRISSET